MLVYMLLCLLCKNVIFELVSDDNTQNQSYRVAS